MRASPLSRRTLLRCALAWFGASLAARWRPAWGTPTERRARIPAALAGFRRTSLHCQHYTVRATISMLGIPIFSRQDVGGGYASVELGTAEGTRAMGLQFAAGAWPHRAAGLNRFGVMKETVTEDSTGRPVVNFAGLISSSTEASLDEARKALKSAGSMIEITMTRGGSAGGNAWVQTEDLAAPAPGSWVEADTMLTGLLARDAAVPPKDHQAEGISPFLATMRKAAQCNDPSFRLPFFHGSKQFLLHAKWTGNGPRELHGVIRSPEGRKLSEFRTRYAPSDTSGVPSRIEYQPRAFLKLTFEADPNTAGPPIPSLFPAAVV